MATMTPDRWTARPGRFLAQRRVRARLIIIRRIRSKDSPQVRLTKDHMALAADGADQTFRVTILPVRSVGRGYPWPSIGT
jgi:hypothetical protein